MPLTKNAFKQALSDDKAQIGLWLGLANAYSAELLANCGFDWLLIDGEHAPNDVRNVLSQLQAVAPYSSHPVVRPVMGDVALIKQYLDLGVQSLLIPMVETAEQAARMVAATRYPPHGIRGVGSALARASRWNLTDNYLHDANDQMCVLTQVESAAALTQLDAIANTPGVDGVFFGPADLAASLGFLGMPGEAPVQKAIAKGIAIVRRAGKAAGILTSDQTLARSYLDMGARFVAVGVDTTLLTKAACDLARAFKGPAATGGPSGSSVY